MTHQQCHRGSFGPAYLVILSSKEPSIEFWAYRSPCLARNEMSFPPRPSGKRDRIRGFFGKSSTASPAQMPKASYRTPSQGSPYPRNGSSILADALEVLCRDDQETIHALMSEKTTNIDAAFNQAYARANVLQQRCAKQRWTWEYNGRQISLSDKIDQVVKFLDRFKSVGDIVSNADPVHFGLPWAGIRGILEVSICLTNAAVPSK